MVLQKKRSSCLDHVLPPICVSVKSAKGDEGILYLRQGSRQSENPSRAAMIYAPELTSYEAC